jgi:hypothetical protein
MRHKRSSEEKPQAEIQTVSNRRGVAWIFLIAVILIAMILIAIRPIVVSISNNLEVRTQERQEKWEMRKDVWAQTTNRLGVALQWVGFTTIVSVSALIAGGAFALVYKWWKNIYHQPATHTISRHKPTLVAENGRYRVIDLYTGMVHDLEEDSPPSMEQAHGVARAIESKGDGAVARLIQSTKRQQVVLDAPSQDE